MEKKENGIFKQEEEEEEDPKYKGWKAMPYVVGNETFEKLGTLGTSSNLLVYLTTIFNMKSVTAATLINVWNGTTNLFTIVGAIFSDTYLGRYTTLGFASIASFLGMVVLTLTAGIHQLHPPHCEAGHECKTATPWQLTFLLTGLGLMVVGAGGIRPCNLAFGADQFNPKTESGKRGINSFFNWYYFTFTISVMISSTLIIYVQSNISWTIGLAIPALLMLFSCAFFFSGSRIYVKVKPEGSPFTSVVQVLVAAFKKRRLTLPPDDSPESLYSPISSSTNSKLPHTDQFRFLDKAAIVTSKDEVNRGGGGSTTHAAIATTTTTGATHDPWRLCSLQQVEEVKCLVRVIPVWSTGIIYYVGVVQQSTYVVFQALQSDRKINNFSVPAASFTVFAMLSLTIWLPLYDRIIVPWLRKVTGKDEGITMLQRMGVGIVLSILTMVVSGLVEERRRSFALHHPPAGTTSVGTAISSMSALWLIFQLTISGLSEAFNLIGQVEFYYKQFPENMRSIAGSFFFCGIAISNYLSGFMVSMVHKYTGKSGGEDNWLAEDLNRGRLDYFYYLIGALGIINFMYFLICSRWYRYKGLGVATEVALENRSNSKVPPV